MIKVTRSKLIKISLTSFILLSCFLLVFLAYKYEKTTQSYSISTMTVEAKPSVSTLYYTALIEPISTFNLALIKNEGVIIKMGFKYGQRINRGQLLFVIDSKELAKEYQTGLSDYIKAKNNYSNVAFEMEGIKALTKLKIISQQEFLTTQTKLFNAELDNAQAESKLSNVLQYAGISKSLLNNIDFNNPDSIIKSLKNAPEMFNIYSPIDGTTIRPIKEGKQTKRLEVGDNIKIGDPLVSIINEIGASFTIKATELDVNRIHSGQKATITSDGCPGSIMHGVVQRVNRAASPESAEGGGIPTFNVVVVTSKQTPYEEIHCRIGMRAEIALLLENQPAIIVPISAVSKQNGQAIVGKVNKKTGKIVPVVVETGSTELNSVEIKKGLSPGDEIIVNAKATN